MCYPLPCLSVDNVSVTTTAPPPLTTKPVTSHPATPTHLIFSAAPDPKGKVFTPRFSSPPSHCSRLPPLSLSLCATLLTLPCSSDGSPVAFSDTHTHTFTFFCYNLPMPCIYMGIRVCTLGYAPCAATNPLYLSFSLSLSRCFSYQWLSDAPRTHCPLSICLCGCVCVCVCGVCGGPRCWWTCLYC